MTSRITQVQPPLEFIPPDFNPLVLAVGRSLIPFWLRWRKGVARTEITNAETLVELYQQFHAGKIRFLLAFRHPSTVDPLVIAQLVWNDIPAIARQQGTPLKQPLHLHFVYDRGIPLWAGPAVAWLIAKLGGTPIRRGSLDTPGLRSIRHLFVHGRFPLAAAPEGGTNGHNEIVSPIEPGIAQFGFWCLEDLKKAKRPEDVMIVPLGIQYCFVTPPWRSLADLLSQLEAESGLQPDSTHLTLMEGLRDGASPSPEQEKILYQRLFALGQHLLEKMEVFYREYYGRAIALEPDSAPPDVDAEPKGESTAQESTDQESTAQDQLGQRLHALLSAALGVAEQALNLKPRGNLTDRCRRVEQASWDRIYRSDVKPSQPLSMLDQGLANLVAEESAVRLWHLRLVETFVSVTGKYVAERPTVERFADTTLLIWTMLRQINQQSTEPKPDLGDRVARVSVGDPIDVSDYWEAYQSKQRRMAIASVTQELQAALESLVQ